MIVPPPPPLTKRLALRRSLGRRLCLLRARGMADDKVRLDGVVAGSGFAFDPVISRCVVSGESLATLVGQAVVGNTFHSGLVLPADWRCVAPKPVATADASSAAADRSYAATTARICRESTPPPGHAADPAPRAALAVRRSACGQIYLLRARADPRANARIDAIAASGGIAVNPVVVPRDDISLTTLVDCIAVDVNGALTIHFGEEIRASPPSATMVSAVEGLVPEKASQKRASSRSSLIVARTPAQTSDVLEALAAPQPAGEACTPRAAGTAKAGPSSSAPAVGAATERGPPIGDVDASSDKVTQKAEGDCAAVHLQVRVRGHQSRLGSTRSFVAPVKEFDAPPGAGTPNQRGAFETRRQAVDDAASVAKVDTTLNDVGATPKEDGASIIATADGRSPQAERVDVVALQMARTRGPPPLEPPDSAPSPPCPSPVDAAAIDQSLATPSRAAYRVLDDAAEEAARRTFATELRRRATSSPDDRTVATRDARFGVEGAPERPAPPTASKVRQAVRADDRAPFEHAYEAWHRRKRDEARARREQLMEALVRADVKRLRQAIMMTTSFKL